MHCYQLLKFEDYYLLILEYIDGQVLSKFIKDQFNFQYTIESLINVRELYEKIKPIEDSPDLRYQYQSIVRNMFKDKVSMEHMKD